MQKQIGITDSLNQIRSVVNHTLSHTAKLRQATDAIEFLWRFNLLEDIVEDLLHWATMVKKHHPVPERADLHLQLLAGFEELIHGTRKIANSFRIDFHQSAPWEEVFLTPDYLDGEWLQQQGSQKALDAIGKLAQAFRKPVSA